MTHTVGCFCRCCWQGETPLDSYTVPAHCQGLDGTSGMWSTTAPRLTIGTSGAGIPFHSHSGTFNEQLIGRKRWGLYSPGRVPPRGYNPDKSYLQWLLSDLPALRAEEAPLQCVQRPGDLLWIPDG
jgi:hypothetical protein